ncbi:hypothetical protein E2562_038108 [Oryza meyeriana var. granulata]|uniref:Retrovirus-related Pol polyprotein from transposon TNT 1-94-like beta-barrel domain-containing protein n=1 Tax=Oryza meyeriana var. granulata TaxID=110450 RepID=A0A6G1EU90_9ORYZ|nr:hypothetical protein E2562_038108 [Oryza meyeriana var. granulata]
MSTASTAGTVVLEELHAQLHIDHKEKLSPYKWYLDMGASNHMLGRKEFFTELNERVHGIVRFGDGSVIDICVFCDVTLECYNSAHHVVADVYYIPRLKGNQS